MWFYLICGLSVISNFSYYPFFQETSWAHPAVMTIWAAMVVILVLIPGKIRIQDRYLAVILFLYVLFILSNLTELVFGNTEVFGNIFFRNISMAAAVLLLGNRAGMHFTREEIEKICLVYMYAGFAMALAFLLFHARHIDFDSRIYTYNNIKNSISVIFLAASAAACFVFHPRNRLLLVIRTAGILVCMLAAALLRCRSVMLAYVLLAVLCVILPRGVTGGLRWPVLFMASALGLWMLLDQNSRWYILERIILAGRSGNLDALSSGRLTLISQGLEVILKHPFLGVGKYKTLDCFYVSVFVSYGLVLAWPAVFIAFMPLAAAIRYIKSNGKPEWLLFALAVLFLTIALLEEQMPFGPGVRCYILWLLLGLLMGSGEAKRYIPGEGQPDDSYQGTDDKTV